jgi:hypothetical protein
LTNPSLEEALKKIKLGSEKQKTILIVGKCYVNYQGRASSKLELGERITIIKEDGALLVHRPKGYEPVNWMPGRNVTFHVKLTKPKNEEASVDSTNKILEIRAMRRKPQEAVTIYFEKIGLVAVSELQDSGEFSLYASEHDMQRAILLEPSLLEEGFKPIGFEKKIEPGFVDVYGIDEKGRLVVVEIKRKTVGKEVALQLAKYVESIKGMVNREVRGILAAPGIAKGVQRVLTTLGLDFKILDPRKCAEILSKPKAKKLEEFL